MNPYWILTLIVAATGGGCAVWLLAKLLRFRHVLDARCGGEFSLDRYQPMAALLSPEDVAFLAEQPGVDRHEVAEFERERRAIFRTYLTELAADFQQLHARAREFVSVAPEQHADLVQNLLRQQISFWVLIARLEIQLALAPLGVQVDARPMINLVGSLGRVVSAGGPVPVS